MLDMNPVAGYRVKHLGERISMTSRGELLQGTLPLLILRTLATGANHGFAIARRIQQISKSVLRVEQGSLYPALHRMEIDGFIESYWDTTENNRKAKYYRLTRRGIRQLERETSRWNAISGAIEAVLQDA
jgi:transcriptional regulator